MSSPSPTSGSAYRNHPTRWSDYKYVYPVVSRRAGGVSIGVNLNPDQTCNFNCVYCQVVRQPNGLSPSINFQTLESEMRGLIECFQSGELVQTEPFRSTPKEFLDLKSIAFAGEGEPTLSPQFEGAIHLACRLKEEVNCSMKVILMTNASALHLNSVKKGVNELWEHGGEVWAKLDAGSERYYELVNRSQIPFEMILRNITYTACRHPIVIQTMLGRFGDTIPNDQHVYEYCKRIEGIKTAGGMISELQLYTVARKPREEFFQSISRAELNEIGLKISKGVSLPVKCFSEEEAFEPSPAK